MYTPTAKSLVLATALLLIAGLSVAQTPKTITYQGRLTDPGGNPVADSTYSVTFRIYDAPVGGTLLWTEPGLPVITQNGLFTATLGSPTPFPSVSASPFEYGPDYIFGHNAELWLEIEVGGSPLTPRSLLQSVPYAMASNSLYGHGLAYPDVSVEANPELGVFRITGYSGEEEARIWGPSWGELILSDGGTSEGHTSEITVDLSATLNYGGSLFLGDSAGTTKMALRAGVSGDYGVIFPDSSIDAAEILNETGIAVARLDGTIFLTRSETSQNFVSVTITIPYDGYIVVDGCTQLVHYGSGANFGWVQITDASNADRNYSVAVWTNSDDYANGSSSQNYQTTPVKSVFFRTTGTYTFYLQGNEWSGNLADNSVEVYNPTWLQATYYPTSYGSVVAAVPSPPADNPNYRQSTGTDPVTGKSGASYNVDLRYYELRAEKAKAEALRAELALEDARLRAEKSESTQQPPASSRK